MKCHGQHKAEYLEKPLWEFQQEFQKELLEKFLKGSPKDLRRLPWRDYKIKF